MMKTRKRKFIGYAAIALLPLGLILYLLWSQLFVHDWYCWRFARSFARIAHPASTRPLLSHRDLGLFIGNGDHIDLFAGEVRSYTGKRQDIHNRYAAQTVPSRLAPGKRVSVAVVFLHAGELPRSQIDPGLFHPIATMLRKAKQRAPSAKHLYIVYTVDAAGFDPGLDIRGR